MNREVRGVAEAMEDWDMRCELSLPVILRTPVPAPERGFTDCFRCFPFPLAPAAPAFPALPLAPAVALARCDSALLVSTPPTEPRPRSWLPRPARIGRATHQR